MPGHPGSIDTRELRELILDFTQAPNRIQRDAPRTMRKYAKKLEQAMKRDARGHRYLPKFAPTMGSRKTDSLGLSWEVGFHRRGQGKLAHIIVFGSVNNAPVYDFHGPLHRETPRIFRELGLIAEDDVLELRRTR